MSLPSIIVCRGSALLALRTEPSILSKVKPYRVHSTVSVHTKKPFALSGKRHSGSHTPHGSNSRTALNALCKVLYGNFIGACVWVRGLCAMRGSPAPGAWQVRLSTSLLSVHAVRGTGWKWAEVVWRNLVRLSCTSRLLAHGSVHLAALDPPLVRAKGDHLELGLR